MWVCMAYRPGSERVKADIYLPTLSLLFFQPLPILLWFLLWVPCHHVYVTPLGSMPALQSLTGRPHDDALLSLSLLLCEWNTKASWDMWHTYPKKHSSHSTCHSPRQMTCIGSGTEPFLRKMGKKVKIRKTDWKRGGQEGLLILATKSALRFTYVGSPV